MVRWLAQQWVGPSALATCATAAAGAAGAAGAAAEWGSAWVGWLLPWCPNTAAAAAGQLLHGNPAPTPPPPLGGGIGREKEQKVGVLSRREGLQLGGRGRNLYPVVSFREIYGHIYIHY